MGKTATTKFLGIIILKLCSFSVLVFEERLWLNSGDIYSENGRRIKNKHTKSLDLVNIRQTFNNYWLEEEKRTTKKHIILAMSVFCFSCVKRSPAGKIA